MLDRLKEFFESLGQAPSRAGPAADDPKVAIAALLHHIGAADGVVTPDESARLETMLEAEFGITRQEALAILEAGRQADTEAVDLYTFTSILMRRLTADQRVRLVEALWEISFVDGAVGELEDNLIWRISELLGVSTRQRMEAKQAAAGRIQHDA